MRNFLFEIFVVFLFVGILLFSGCSKREKVLGCVAFLSGAGAGASILDGHFGRINQRKQLVSSAEAYAIEERNRMRAA